MTVYYNEFDKAKCAALSQLMAEGFISKGDIDDRSITDVRADDVRGYDRCHFFAGIGLWDHALNLAGWQKDRPVWTGSCPCQPFSTAGRQKGKADLRHLWPEWFRLIEECRPATIFGEQVASAITKGWLDDVYQGLEAQNYALGSAVLPASAVGAPHRRERLWFVGNTECEGLQGHTRNGENIDQQRRVNQEQERSAWQTGVLAHTTDEGLQDGRGKQNNRQEKKQELERLRSNGFWQASEWIDCPDGKQRLVEPRIPLLADGYPERVGVIHCAGDAIVSQVAAEFISAFISIT